MHKAKNLVPAGAGQKPTATGEAVYGLQQAIASRQARPPYPYPYPYPYP